MLRNYSVCYSEKEDFDWCIVNNYDVVLTNGVGNMAQVRDIVEAANKWFAQVYEEQTRKPQMLKPPAQKGDKPRVRFNARVTEETLKVIKQLSKLWGKSQGEVLDELAKAQNVRTD